VKVGASIQMRQQFAKIGIESEPGRYEIKQPRPNFEMNTKHPKLVATYHRGELTIDSTRAREAFGKGNVFQFTRLMAQEGQRLALEGIGRRVDEGNRMKAIHTGQNAIADIAYDSVFRDFKINYEGPFTPDPVDVTYTAVEPDMQFEPGSVSVQSSPNPPQIQYHVGKVRVYLQQKASLEITPPVIDQTV